MRTKIKKAAAILLTAVMLFTMTVVAPVTGAVDTNQYAVSSISSEQTRDEIIQTVINNKEVWRYEKPIDCLFIDVDFDGKLEFLSNSSWTTWGNHYQLYEVDTDNDTLIDCGYLITTEDTLDLTLWYDKVTDDLVYTQKYYKIGRDWSGQDIYIDELIRIGTTDGDINISKVLDSTSGSEYEDYISNLVKCELSYESTTIYSFLPDSEIYNELKEAYDSFYYVDVRDNFINYSIFKADKLSDMWSYYDALNGGWSPYRNIVEEKQAEDGIFSMENFAKAYVNLGNLNDLRQLVNQNQSYYYYEIILADIFSKQKSSEEFNSNLADSSLAMAKTLTEAASNKLKDYLTEGLKTTLDKNLKEQIKNILSDYEVFESEMFVVDTLLDYVDTFEAFFEKISTYMTAKEFTEETVYILEKTAERTSNSGLKTACNDMVNYFNSSLDEILDSVILPKTTAEVVCTVTQQVIDSLVAKCPYTAIAKCIYDTGKSFSAFLTNSEETSTLYLQMLATYEIDNEFDQTLQEIREAYLDNPGSLEESKRFNTAFQLMVDVANYGNDILIDFCKAPTDSLLGAIKDFFKLNEDTEKFIEILNENKNDNIVGIVQKSIDNIYYEYLAAYPEIANTELENYLNNSKFSIISMYAPTVGVIANTDDKTVPKDSVFEARELTVAEQDGIKTIFDGNQKLLTAYDMTVSTADGAKVEINPEGYITIKLPVPDGVINDKALVYRIDENGATTKYDAQIVDGMVVFNTNHFSIYAVVTETEPTPPTDPSSPTSPTDPSTPTDPTSPTDPTDVPPTDPTNPSDPTDPSEAPTNTPTDPTNPTTAPGGSNTPTSSTTPTKSVSGAASSTTTTTQNTGKEASGKVATGDSGSIVIMLAVLAVSSSAIIIFRRKKREE